MPRRVRSPTWTKDFAEVVGKLNGDVQKLAFAGRLIVGHRRFDQVAGAIELMAVLQILPAFFGFD